LIYLTRDPRNGQGEKDVSYILIKWLRKYCPKTYGFNILNLCEKFGRFDDLLKIIKNETTPTIEHYLFTSVLKRDLENDHPSLAVKWAPRECNDKKNAKIFAKLLFPKEKNYMEKYRKEIIAPLSKKVNILETLLCQNKWNEINYSSVPASAMKLYGRKFVKVPFDKSNHDSDKHNYSRQGAFYRHDDERFSKYLKDVKLGKEKINVSGIEPHKLIEHYLIHNEYDDMIECQWKKILEDVSKFGKLQSSLALVDVSGSMNGEPMNVAIALGLIVSNLADKPFNKKMITFEENPHMVKITGTTLLEQTNEVRKLPWGGTTNFISAFRLIISTAKFFNIPKEQMIKTFYVFTDMQFDHASSTGSLETVYETIEKEFLENEYNVPNIVFWNLRCCNKNAFPVEIGFKNTALVSGFSKELLKVFMSGCEFEPMTILIELVKKYIPEISIDTDEKEMKFL
jgi:hypothetical protein